MKNIILAAIILTSISAQAGVSKAEVKSAIASYFKDHSKKLKAGVDFKIEDQGQDAKNQSNKMCLAFLDTLPLSEISKTSTITIAQHEQLGESYYSYGPNSRHAYFVGNDVHTISSDVDVEYEITGCESTCQQERITFSRSIVTCNSDITFNVKSVSKVKESVTGTVCDSGLKKDGYRFIDIGSCSNQGFTK